ncbi:MAG: hypothetical protein Q7R33_02915 [Nitrosarchaeum sp.]|nr:hypothetical protein [Nitrosarchaeum sp.]
MSDEDINKFSAILPDADATLPECKTEFEETGEKSFLEVYAKSDFLQTLKLRDDRQFTLVQHLYLNAYLKGAIAGVKWGSKDNEIDNNDIEEDCKDDEDYKEDDESSYIQNRSIR